jgi:tetratricopeptide (TPR) repeat protein
MQTPIQAGFPRPRLSLLRHVRSLGAVALACVFALAAGAAAQDDPYAKDLEALNKEVAKRLSNFARLAERNGVASRAREAYQLIVDEYEPDNSRALKALGYERDGTEWKKPDVPPGPDAWRDKADDEKRFEVLGDWNSFAQKIADEHRELGLKMVAAGDKDRGAFHLERAIYFNPNDVEAHKALGHTEVDGFWGTAEDVAFVSRMRAIEIKAAELSKKEYPFEELSQDDMPAELKKIYEEDADYEFFGARNEHFEYWTRGTQKDANDCVLWAERACEFIEFLLPPELAKRVDLAATAKRNRAWVGFVWTRAEQEMLLKLNPNIASGLDFANNTWRTDAGIVEVQRALAPVNRLDSIISHMVKLIGGNDCINEGVMHAATWYLRGSTVTRYGAVDPNQTTTGGNETLPDAGAWWMREIRDQATAGTSFPLNGLPRVQLSNFRNDARVKTWSFHVWCLARYPEKWFEWLNAFESESRPFPEVVDEKASEIFGRPLAEVEEDWRWWAAGRSGTASATGYGPPLLPEAPNRDQLRALERLNEFRALAGLPPCEIDLEATEACKKHALFLQQNPETHWTWPEAHEEDPSLPGFTTPGQRAGMRSVIITSERGTIDAADSLDGWIGTVYHRFPLFEPNIRRIGFGHVGNVVVLDMGSLQEPTTPEQEEQFRFIEWPLDGMENVPLTFHPREQPDPLQFTDEGRDNPDLQLNVGYPVSLQLRTYIVNQLVGSDITVFEIPKRARGRNDWKVLPAWVHTPDKPLNKNVENTSVVFAIPKEPLEPRTTYRVEVVLTTKSGEEKREWEFTTGTQRTGHGRLKLGKSR